MEFTNLKEINTLELSKLPPDADSSELWNWMKFIKSDDGEVLEMIAERNPQIRKAVVELKRLSQDEEAQRLYDAREKALWDEHSRLRTAVNKNSRDIATNLIKMGMTNEQIHEATGLSIADIEALKAK